MLELVELLRYFTISAIVSTELITTTQTDAHFANILWQQPSEVDSNTKSFQIPSATQSTASMRQIASR